MGVTESSYLKPLLVLAFVLPSVGCGTFRSKSSPASTEPQQVSIQLNQTSVNLQTGAQLQFTATVLGTSNTAVTWAVDNVNGGNSGAGTITSAGLYTAPNQSGTHQVSATSVADKTKSASATVTIVGNVSISPSTSAMLTGATQQFQATVTGQSNATITWSVDGVAGGNSNIGTISSAGLYKAPSQTGSHTVGASIGSGPGDSASAPVTVFSLSISPGGTLLLPGATQQFTATIQGLENTSVTWSVDGIAGGSNAVGTIDASGLYTAPSGTGAHAIGAASVEYPSASVSSRVVIANQSAGAVLTYHNDDARDGAYIQETTLTPSVVNSSQFGKLRFYGVDGQMYAQPLYVPQLKINGALHNVVFVATENNSVYAFDADGLQSSALWQKNLGAPQPRNDVEGISPQLGITSTPVIDITSNTIYILAETSGDIFNLHALDITSGAEKFGGPVQVNGSISGTGWDSNNGTIQLERDCYQRLGLALNPASNQIYIGFGHCNHGWLFAYDKTSLQQKAIFNVTPDGAGGGLWNGGGAPAIDDQSGNVFITTGVDQDDPLSGYNDSFLRLSPNDLSVQDFFTPDDASYLSSNDADLGSGSPVLMPDNSSNTPHEIIGGGKDGKLFVVNRDSMGSFSPTSNNVVEVVQTGVHQFDNIFSTPAYWNGFLYIHAEGDVLRQFTWNNGQLSNSPVNTGQFALGAHGATCSLSSNGSTNGIIWEIDNSSYPGGASILRAYDATNVGKELYDSTQAGSRDQAGAALKFTVPTVADGKVFVGTSNELDIYGLLGQ
jgi:hypothetical protein